MKPAAWSGDDLTIGAGSNPLTPRPPTSRTTPEPPAGGSRDRDESSAVALGWSGDDITVGGGSGPITPRPAGTWSGEEGTGVVAALADGADAVRWLAEEVAAHPSASTGTTVEWLGDDVTLPGGGPRRPPVDKRPDPRLGQQGLHTPIHTGATPAIPAANARTSSSGSDRLRLQGGADPRLIREALRSKDAAWLDDGRKGDLSGRTLGDFLVGTVLGEGGMGVVYRARQISLDRRVALKVLPPAMAADPVLMERFAGEAHTAGLLVSPHVVQVYFAGSVDDQVFFAMEFVSGTDLARHIADHNDAGTLMSASEAGCHMAEAARGLAEAERHQVVHRDIKPQNLLLTGDGVVKIADFGIAKVMGEHHLTMTGSAIGTPAYCSPEQGRGDPVDQRSDLYALGVVFYELLVGQKPFAGNQAGQLIYQHNYVEPKPPRSLRPDLPAAYEAVCMRLLMKDPEQRYQHATDLAQDLESLIAGGKVQAPPFEIRFGTGAQAAMRRHLGLRRWLPWTIAATLAVGVGVALWMGSRSLEADEVTRRRAALASLDVVATVPRSAVSDLAWLAEHLGQDQADVRRWRAKLERIEVLRGSLLRLDAEGVGLDAALRKAGEADCAAWEAEVGTTDPDGLRWRGILQVAQEEIARLRGQLVELDRSDPLTVAQVQRLRPSLQRLVLLAGDDDGDGHRWQGLVDGQERRLAAARSALAGLTGTAVIPEVRLKVLRGEWRLFRAMCGEDDRDAAAWGRQLDQREADVRRLRETGTRLDRVDLATTTLQAEVAGDLERLAALVPAEDPQLTAWRTKITLSNQRIEALRQGLGAVLDALGHPDAGTLASCQRQLAEYRSLVSPDDGRLATWERRLMAEHQGVQDLQATLRRCDQEAPLTLEEQAVCRRALEELVRRGALGDDRRGAGERRLAAEAARIAGLRSVLADADRSGGGITPALTTAVAALAVASPGDDPEVRRWQQRIAEHGRLREALAVLDRRAPPPVEVGAQLEAYAALAPRDDDDLRRWRTRVARIAELHHLLEPLARAEPPPEGVVAWLDELAEQLTGPQDAPVVAGRAKLVRLAELESRLAVLGTAIVLPVDPDPARDLATWAELVGTGDDRWRAWDLRYRQLAGPGRPAWAFAHGRDAQGPWADLVVNGNHQRLRFIPGGTMRLGSPVDEAGRDADESPPRERALGAFWLADSECPQALYAGLMNAWPAEYRGPDRPVENITRAEALRFCAVLSRTVAGVEARLPSEQEWEYACRAGTDGPFSGPTGNLALMRLGEVAWYGRGDGPRAVRLLQPNRFGLFDCQGNVWEWVADRYLSGDGRSGGDDGVVRGGSWADRPLLLRAANRLAWDPERRSAMVGFRFAISVEEAGRRS